MDSSHQYPESQFNFGRGFALRDGTSADVLDIISIPMISATPQAHQTENHVIDPNYYWAKQGQATWAQIMASTDPTQGALWTNGDSSYHGHNDKVAEVLANTLTSSLRLIAPTRLELRVGLESMYGGGSKRKVRADFDFNHVRYNFVVTDPHIEATYFAGQDGTYPIAGSRLCVSLAEAINGIATKLVATVLTSERMDQ